jgi:hypothetical protein
MIGETGMLPRSHPNLRVTAVSAHLVAMSEARRKRAVGLSVTNAVAQITGAGGLYCSK